MKTRSSVRPVLVQMLRLTIMVLAIYLLFTQVDRNELIAILQNANLAYLALGAILFQVATVVRAIRWWVLLKDAGVDVRPATAIGLTHISEFAATALPISYAGDAIRILELDGKHSKAEITGIGVADRLMGMAVLMSVCLLSLALGYHLLPQSTALTVGVLALVSLIAIIAVTNPVLQRLAARLIPGRFAATPESRGTLFYQGIMRRSPRMILIAVIISLVNVIFTVMVHYVIAVGMLEMPLTAGHFFVFTPVINLSLLFPSIGGLGIREVGYALILAPFGITAERAVGLGLGIYLTRMWVALIGGGLWLRRSLTIGQTKQNQH